MSSTARGLAEHLANVLADGHLGGDRNKGVAAIADALEEILQVDSVAWRVECEHCAALARSWIAHGGAFTVRYHHPDCPTGMGCSCGCYTELEHSLGDDAIAIMQGIPEEFRPNRAARRHRKRGNR